MYIICIITIFYLKSCLHTTNKKKLTVVLEFKHLLLISKSIENNILKHSLRFCATFSVVFNDYITAQNCMYKYMIINDNDIFDN